LIAEANQLEGAQVFSIPKAAEPLSEAIRNVFTCPTFERFTALMMGLIVTMGRRTVSHALAVMEPVLEGHWSNYHRLYSSAKFSMWELAAVLVRQVVALLPADTVIELAADDTVDGKSGDHVWAKSAHRDSARSSGAKTNIKFGHKWLVLCVLVRLKGWDRPWALPILCGLCISPKVSAANNIRPKTPSQLARQLLIRLMRWLPNRKFILIGDYQVVTHQTAEFARRHSDRVTAIGRLRGDANLYAAPVNPYRKSCAGGWIKKGRKMPSPAKQIETLEPASQNIAWYGGSRREMRLVSELALWHDKHGNTATPIRWVCVLGDAKAGLENAFFFCSDPAMAAARIVEYYARRWNIEVTFEESRALLGLETTRHWCRRSVLRVTPILLGLFSGVVLIWKELPEACQQLIVSGTPCYQKSSVTFADVLGAVRQELWEQVLLRHHSKNECLTQLPEKLRQTILWHLSAAA
jgi:DDE superfamily endonuclease